MEVFIITVTIMNHKKTWTLILPLRVVENLEAEFTVKNLHTKTQHQVKCNVGTAVILGLHTFHAISTIHFEIY